MVSRWLSQMDRYASRPLAAVLVIGAAGVGIVVSIAAGFPARWEAIFQTLVAALTLTMVFVIQHTQQRQQRATQRKLDEILQALPGTDKALLTPSAPPMRNCAPPDTSTARSARPHSTRSVHPVWLRIRDMRHPGQSPGSRQGADQASAFVLAP